MSQFWDKVKERYKPGMEVPQLYPDVLKTRTKSTFTILDVDDEYLHFKWGVVRHGTISRSNLERMAELIEDGVVKQDLDTLVSDYRTIVSDERPTTACALLVDMGIINYRPTLEEKDKEDAE